MYYELLTIFMTKNLNRRPVPPKHSRKHPTLYDWCFYSTGLGDGAVAGIVIAVLILAGLGILGTIIVIYYTKTYKKRARYG